MNMGSILYYLYRFKSRKFRLFIKKQVLRFENGEMFSKTLRRIFKDFHNIEVGMFSYGCFSTVNVPSGTEIGRYCSFARDVCLLNGNHPLKYKSMHPFFYNPVFGFVDQLKIKRTKIRIENDVWIGRNVIITPSVSCISNGAVVGAGSVVTKNVPPFAVVAGNPAKIIKLRFQEEMIEEILLSRWWERDIYDLVKDKNFFREFENPFYSDKIFKETNSKTDI